MHGDGITIGDGTSEITITNNIFDTGYCYLIWAHGHISKVNLSDNNFISGTTTAVNLDYVEDAMITKNEFSTNFAHGLGIGGGNNIQVFGNTFNSNNLMVLSTVQASSVTDNIFNKITPQTNPVDIHSKDVYQSNNQIHYTELGKKPELTILVNGAAVHSGDSVTMLASQSSMLIQIKNSGDEFLQLEGAPQVLLSENPLPPKNRGPKKSGTSAFGSFYIASDNEPDLTTLLPGKQITVDVHNKVGINNSVIVNIPTSSPEYQPFWFRITTTG